MIHKTASKPVANAIKFFVKGEAGATLIEYALIIALMVLIVAVSVGSLGTAVDTLYGNIAAAPF